jgi:hypothetical protein
MIKKYQLNFQKAKKYFEKNLTGTNKLSDSVISFLKFESGDFFALLTEKSKIEDINEFEFGGKTNCLINDVGEFIFNLIKLNGNVSCIFDDFNADLKNIDGDPLFNSNGLDCSDEIYYVINKNAEQDLAVQCLRRSNVIWHSLCIVSEFEFKENKKTITQADMEKICLNAKLIMIGAYDAESYIIWEKK